MVGIKHVTKRAFHRVSTRQKTINTGLNQEFVESRRRLSDISTAVKKLNKSIHTTRQVWMEVAKHQRDFSSTLSASFPQGGDVQSHAVEVENLIRTLQQCIMDDDDGGGGGHAKINNDGGSGTGTTPGSVIVGAPHRRIVTVLQGYLNLLNDIEKEYKPVEVAFTEKQRYQYKVDRLEKRRTKASTSSSTSPATGKTSARLTRNLEKFNKARNELDMKVNAVISRMRDAFDKHEAVLQCAHHAFWMANDAYLKTVTNVTKDIRLESVAVHDRLLDVKVEENRCLLPIPRQSVIEPDDEQQEQQQEQQRKQEEQQQHQYQQQQQLLTSGTSTPSDATMTSTEDGVGVTGNVTVIENGRDTQLERALNIPDVPTDKPNMPSVAPRASKVAAGGKSLTAMAA